MWIADGKLVSVGVVLPRETDAGKESGPTPKGEYLVGKRYQHEKYACDWYQLSPIKENNSGYYAYADQKLGRSHLALHPGQISEGCVTVKVKTQDSAKYCQWALLKGPLMSASKGAIC